jgi:RNA polymerase sigma-70 factor (ECF subfamily)
MRRLIGSKGCGLAIARRDSIFEGSQVAENYSQQIYALRLVDFDQDAFGALVEPHRRELQAHCYRMMGSVQDAEDMVQETFLRAWRRRETFEGRASFRAWLYKIATNVCLDVLKKRPRRVIPVTRQPVSTVAEPIPPAVMESIWLEPYPDDLLIPSDDNPEGYFSIRENITMAFVAALHLLPPRQRAILILRDVLDWQANEVAALLDMTVPAVKSALHRARATLADHGYSADSEAVPHLLDEGAQTLLDDYVLAWETADVEALLRLLKEDATFSMPPIPSWYQGRDEIRGLTSKTIFSGQANGRWRLLPTRANRQLAFGLYRQSDDPAVYNAYGIQVLTFSGDLIADITTFRNPALFPHFKLPATLHAGGK